jgi:hypothetical protein
MLCVNKAMYLYTKFYLFSIIFFWQKLWGKKFECPSHNLMLVAVNIFSKPMLNINNSHLGHKNYLSKYEYKLL